MPDQVEVEAGLRHWARGIYPQEAGVELLCRAFAGRFARPGYPWVQPGESPGSWWIDPEAMTGEAFGGLSGGERRYLAVAASLLGGPPVDLSDVSGMDFERQDLIVLAVLHAGGRRQDWDAGAPSL